MVQGTGRILKEIPRLHWWLASGEGSAQGLGQGVFSCFTSKMDFS